MELVEHANRFWQFATNDLNHVHTSEVIKGDKSFIMLIKIKANENELKKINRIELNEIAFMWYQ